MKVVSKNLGIVLFFSVVLLLFLPLVLNFVSSQISGINPENASIFGITPDSGVKLTEKWEYLGKEWKNIIMSNPVIRAIDFFFQKISFIFLVLLGEPYSLSIAFFLLTFIWLYVFFMAKNVLQYTIFSKWVAVVISIGACVLLAQTRLFQLPVNAIIGLFFGEKPWWLKLIIGVIVFGIVAAVFVIVTVFSKQYAESKKKMEEEVSRMKLKMGAKVGEQLSKAVSKKVK